MKKNFFTTLPQKTKIILLALIGGIILIGGWGYYYFFGKRPNPATLTEYLASLPDHSKIAARIGTKEYTFEIVNTPSSITQGLSDRPTLGSDGMLFVMPVKTTHTFWMLRMNFDLDLLWLDDDTIVQIMPNIPAPPLDAKTWQLPLYTSQKSADLVLEIPAGRAELMQIKVGDKLKVL